MNGKIVIGTEINDDGIDKGIVSIEKKMEKLREKAEQPYEINGVKIVGGWNLSEEEQKYYDRLETSLNNLYLEKSKMITVDQQITAEVEKQNNAISQQSSQIENQNEKYISSTKRLAEISAEIEDLVKSYNSIQKQDIVSEQDLKDAKQLKTDIIALKKEYEKLSGTKLNIKGITDTKRSLNDIGNGIKGIVRETAKWALAVFGIRSAYNAVRNAINVIANDDAQLKADIDYMKNALAYALEPVVRAIVNLMKQLMFYIGYIVKAWTGKNIFENANKSLKNATKNAKQLNKELNKTLAGFDEMNVLQENSSSGYDSDGAVSPSFDLSKIDGKVPKWLEFIAKNGDKILAIMAGVASALKAWKLGFTALKSLGIGVVIAGIVYAIEGLLKYLKDPSWENFGQILQGIGIAIIGLGILFLGLPGIIAGVIVLIVATIIKYWDKIKEFLQGGIDWLAGKSDWIRETFGDFIGDLYDAFVENLQDALNWLDTMFTSIKANFDEIISFMKNVFAGDWEAAWQNLKNIAINIWTGIKTTMGTIFTQIGRGAGTIISSAFKAVVNAVINQIEKLLNGPINALNGLIDTVNLIPGVNFGKLNTIKLPRLAQGGIVNNPGPGVMMGSYIAGERGPEAVIPLDDETMNRLGESIARHMSVNLTNINQMNSRVIGREMKRVFNESDFSYNR